MLTKWYKRILYRWLYLEKDITDAKRMNDPDRVASTLGNHIRDIFWDAYKKEEATMKKTAK